MAAKTKWAMIIDDVISEGDLHSHTAGLDTGSGVVLRFEWIIPYGPPSMVYLPGHSIVDGQLVGGDLDESETMRQLKGMERQRDAARASANLAEIDCRKHEKAFNRAAENIRELERLTSEEIDKLTEERERLKAELARSGLHLLAGDANGGELSKADTGQVSPVGPWSGFPWP